MANSSNIAKESWSRSITTHLRTQASSTVTIHKVPERIRRGEKDAYEPRIISFGPYHHGKASLRAMEKYKYSFLEVILSFRPQIPLERYRKAIKEEEGNIRKCYTDDFDSDIRSDDFVEMMLVDGCFLVGYLLQIYYFGFPSELDLDLDSIVGMHDLIRYDILLLENQLPFFILIKIFDLLRLPTSPFPSSFMVLAIHYLDCREGDKKDNFQSPESVHHLLHLSHLHCLYTPLVSTHGGEPKSCATFCVTICEEESGPIDQPPISGPIHQPPSATVLHEAGVKFKKGEVNGSSLDVTFDIPNGKMMIPPLVIDTFNMARLRNFVAFEQLYPNSDKLDKSFTAFVEFMDFIVNTPEDVALLHKEGIISHFLGSDKNAADFLNDLNEGVFVKPEHYLAPLYRDVYLYRQKRWPNWRAVLMHNYCNSPWAVLGIVAGGILLVFTLLQTFFSGISTFQSPLSPRSH